jgi:hypothetical protein
MTVPAPTPFATASSDAARFRTWMKGLGGDRRASVVLSLFQKVRRPPMEVAKNNFGRK